jgi:hypothetical protein
MLIEDLQMIIVEVSGIAIQVGKTGIKKGASSHYAILLVVFSLILVV